jgi:hypothetical protein
MNAQLPIHRVLSVLEIREQGDGDFEGGELRQRDGREAVVGEGAGQRVGGEARGEGLGFEGPDAAA